MADMVKVICVTCPKGCTLQVTQEGKTVLDVQGAGCKRGRAYVEGELTDPRRMVASTIAIRGARHPLLPVSTSAPFPKGRIPELTALLRSVEVHSPVVMGEVVVANALGTGIDILASRDM